MRIAAADELVRNDGREENFAREGPDEEDDDEAVGIAVELGKKSVKRSALKRLGAETVSNIHTEREQARGGGTH